MIEERFENDKVEIISQAEGKVIQVRKASIIEKDGVEISRSFERYMVTKDTDPSSLDADIKKIFDVTF